MGENRAETVPAGESEYAKLREEIRAGFARIDRFLLTIILGVVFLVIEKILGFF